MAKFHIVTAAQQLSGAETYVRTLVELLASAGHSTTVWRDGGTSGQAPAGQTINSFSRQFPRGDTLILVGSYLRLEPWITHTKPQRLIFICNTSDPSQAYRTLALLAHPQLPTPEVAYVSSRLRDGIGHPGIVCPEVINTEAYTPTVRKANAVFTIGRLSRDHPDKHHPEDSALYRLLAWQGAKVRIMGGSCLMNELRHCGNCELLPVDAEPGPNFLRSLDVFFYRTSPKLHEAAGRVVMEALASGLPVIAHVSGGYTDWIQHGENGFLFARQEEALGHLLSLRSDSHLRSQLGQAARETAMNLASFRSPPVKAFLSWLLERS